MEFFRRFTSWQASKRALTGLPHCRFWSVNCHVRTAEFKPVRILTDKHTFDSETCSLDFIWNGAVCFGNVSVLFWRYLVNLSKNSYLTDRGNFILQGRELIKSAERKKIKEHFASFIFISSPEHKVLMVSYCDRALSVVRRRPSSVVRKRFYLNISSETTHWILTKLHRNDPWVVPYQSSSNGSDWLHK